MQSFRQYEHVSMYLQSKITDKNTPLSVELDGPETSSVNDVAGFVCLLNPFIMSFAMPLMQK